MKKCFFIFCIILSLTIIGYSADLFELSVTAQEGYPSSKITTNDCYLCGFNRPFDFIDRPHDTVMILCLKNWCLGDTTMYQYDSDGKDSNYSGASILRGSQHGEGECRWSFESNTGYHTCKILIHYDEASQLDPADFSKKLCPSCLEQFYEQIASRCSSDKVLYCDVLYDTASEEVYPISGISSPYRIGDYWIHIDHDAEQLLDEVYIIYNPDSTK